jgi:hypothetical protein
VDERAVGATVVQVSAFATVFDIEIREPVAQLALSMLQFSGSSIEDPQVRTNRVTDVSATVRARVDREPALGGAARKLDQSAAQKVIHWKDVHSTLFAFFGLFPVRGRTR